MRDQMFRKAALERLSSPEQLDQLMQVTSPRAWLALATLGAILLAALLWSIFGSIPTKVEAQGILIRKGGLHEIVALTPGRVTEMDVAAGDTVAEGEIVARLAQPELQAQLDAAQLELAHLEERDSPELARPLLVQRQRVEALKHQLDSASTIVSRYRGRVLETRTEVGRVVTAGASILSLESDDAELEALLYVPAAEGKKVRVGMPAYVSPSTVSREEYGLIDGKVTSISSFPASRHGMMHVLANEKLVERLSESGAPLEVRADLAADPHSESGFRWTSAGGPPEKVDSGTLCTGLLKVRTQRPITLVIPFLREKTGL
jgi:multidrug efflux pump subunit AcrA (membrane-fusion protein)